MIRIERDPAFWTAVASHPACAGALMGLPAELVGAHAASPNVLPLAGTHGGFLLTRLDPFGLIAELHTLFTPEGWGREVVTTGIEAIGAVWTLGFAQIVTHEMENLPRSRPARTFGFRQCGAWKETPVGRLRLWAVSRQDWIASPAAARRRRHLH